MKIAVNYDFNFSNSYELTMSPFAQFYKDKILNLTGDLISSRELVIFHGNLTQVEDCFNVKGKLDKDKQIDKDFNLTVYSNTSDLIQTLCETTNGKFDDYEIECEKDKSVDFNINNSISFMESKQLFVVVNGDEKVFAKTKAKTKKYNLFYNYYSNNNTSLSSGTIVLIVIVIVIVCVIVGLMIIFRKKLFKTNNETLHSKENSESYVNLKLSNVK
jgi:cell division protein FtsL